MNCPANRNVTGKSSNLLGVKHKMGDFVNENSVVICGSVVSEPKLSHENHGKEFWGFALAVRRLSGVEDRLNIVMERGQLEKAALSEGDFVEVRGVLHTYNNKSGVGSRLVITVNAQDADKLSIGEPENSVDLTGTICKAPVYRRTPLGREICDIMLAVNRRSGRADYIPCILWGETARAASALGVGSRVSISGRLQSRTYIKNIDGVQVPRTAFEVSAASMKNIDV